MTRVHVLQQDKWMELLGCCVLEQVILDKNFGEGE
jgi:hypothetical protein